MKINSSVVSVVLAGAFSFSVLNLRAEDVPPPPQSVEERLAILERKYEIAQEEAAAKAKDGASVTAGKGGFQIKSNDSNFVLKLTGYIQTDYRDYLSDANQSTDQFLLRRVRPSIEGTIYKVVDFRILPDFANGGGTANNTTAAQPNGQTGTTVTGTLLQDAYVELKTFPAFKIRAGKFKGPFSLERLQSGTALNFIERGFASSLGPNRNTGIQLSGDFGDGLFTYQAGVFNGSVDGGSEETDTTDGKDYIGRVFAHPFKRTVGFMQGLGIGIAGSVGDQVGTATTSQLPSFRTNGQQTFFSYRAGDTFAYGDRTRYSPQGYWYNNNLSLFGEYTVAEQDVRRATTTTTTDSLTNRAWVVAGTWVLTGEKATFKGVRPKKAFDPKEGGWGAFELAGRYSEFRIDGDAFPRYANIATAARRAKAWTGGFNWYVNDAVKVTSNYEYTTFEGGATNGNRRPERAILSRVQLVY